MRLKPSVVDWTKPTALRLWETDGEVWAEYHNGPQQPMPYLTQEFRVDGTLIHEYLETCKLKDTTP